MKNTSPQIKYMIVSFLFLVLACLSFWFVLEKIKDNKRETDEMEIDWQTESTRRYDLNSLERSLKSVEAQTTELETHFVHTYDIVTFLNHLEYLGNLVGVEAKIKSVDSVEEELNPVLVVGIDTFGDFVSTYKFLTLLENSQYEIEITNFSMSKSGNSDPANTRINWGGSLTIKLLSFIP